MVYEQPSGIHDFCLHMELDPSFPFLCPFIGYPVHSFFVLNPVESMTTEEDGFIISGTLIFVILRNIEV